MSNANPAPYVPVELLGGRLVRVCPECKEQIGERTDDEGIVSDNFAEHYGARARRAGAGTPTRLPARTATP